MSDIAKLWARLETWSKANAPAMLSELKPGATTEQLAKLEQALGRELPDDYRESLRVHNGETDGWPFRVFADMGAYHSCDAVLEDRNEYFEIIEDSDEGFVDDEDVITVDGPVKSVLFHEDWVPIMNSGGGPFFVLDFAPEASGVDGQVVRVDLEDCAWRVVANSFAEMMNDYVAALEAGEFEIDSEGLATRHPEFDDPERDAEIEAAFNAAPSVEDLDALEPGAEVSLVGMRVGDPLDRLPVLWIRNGPVKLRGSLGDATRKDMLRVHIRVGGRGEGPHELVGWEVMFTNVIENPGY